MSNHKELPGVSAKFLIEKIGDRAYLSMQGSHEDLTVIIAVAIGADEDAANLVKDAIILEKTVSIGHPLETIEKPSEEERSFCTKIEAL